MNAQRNIIITGCSSGIGLCVAKGLKERGYRVFATARRQQDVKELNKQGFESYQLDLTNSQSMNIAVGTLIPHQSCGATNAKRALTTATL